MRTNRSYQKPEVQDLPIPKISIGMPVYNSETFIRVALDSILNQTFTDFELIISDNASTDKTETICREYAAKDSRIRFIRQEINRGPVINFKVVLDEAKGKYFKWLAYDDYLEPSFIETTAEFLDKNDDVVLCTTDVKVRRGNGEKDFVIETYDILREHNDWNKSILKVIVCLSPYVNKSFKTNFTKPIYGIFRVDALREAYLETTIMDRIIKDEFPLLTRIAFKGRIVALDLVLWTYRSHADATSAKDALFNSSTNRYFRHHLLWDIYKIYLIITNRLNIQSKFLLIPQIILHHPLGMLIELRIIIHVLLRLLFKTVFGEHRARDIQKTILKKFSRTIAKESKDAQKSN